LIPQRPYRVTIGDDATIEGRIRDVEGAVTIGSGAKIKGKIRDVNGDLIIGEEAEIEGQITISTARLSIIAANHRLK
jgi:predicted acyltransferase (DUF342 family)